MHKLGMAFLAMVAVYDPAVAETIEAHETPSAFSWTGGYIGVHAGYGQGDGGGDYYFLGGPSLDSADVGQSGRLGGIQAGYDHQIDSWVIGVEGEIGWSGMDGFNNIYAVPGGGFQANISVDTRWMAGITGRVGYTFERTMLFLKGGIAAANVSLGESIPVGGIDGVRGADTISGWTFGLGVERSFNDKWAIRGEYQYYRFNADIDIYDRTNIFSIYDDDIDVSSFKIGLNYRF